MSDWHPIEAAPKDGTLVLLAHKPLQLTGQTQSVARLVQSADGSSRWCIAKDATSRKWLSLPVPATHWMPLPDDPSSSTRQVYTATWTLEQRPEDQ